MRNDEISRLLDDYVALAESPRNKELLQETWLRPNLAYIEDIGVPRAGVVPIIANPFLSLWAREMGISVSDLYWDPETYLRVWLSREIGRFTQIQDDRPLSKRVVHVMGAGFQSTLFGARQVYMPDQDPLVDPTPVLERPEDLDRLELPDFYKSGLMPLAHRFYEEMSELVKGHRLEIVFPYWARSPFAMAHRLRGEEQLLVDVLQRPDFVKRLLEFLTHSAIYYRTERAKFLGIPLDRPEFSNDEVNVPSISPRLYRDLLLPFEKAYATVCGGLLYWHSCGNVTPMIPLIREIPDIMIFHVGPWTDVEKAAEVFGDVTLDICLEPLDLYQAEEAMRAKVTSIVETCWQRGAHSFSIRIGAFLAFKSPEEDLSAAARWVRVAKETVAQLVSQSRLSSS